MKLKIVQVEWEDITGVPNTWVLATGKEDKKYTVSQCQTVGFLVKKTGKVVITAQNYSIDYDGDVQWGGLEVIPRGVIRRIHTIRRK